MAGSKQFPNETDEYRDARNDLLAAEVELRTAVQRVAAKRQSLPLGGALKEDYEFDELVAGEVRQVKLSSLFAAGQDSLFIYSYMYGPDKKQPCPLCTSMLDGMEGQFPHITRRISMAVAAKSPIDRVMAVAESRGWHRLRLLSSAHNSYNRDYFGEDDKGNQMPMANVFVRRPEGIHHFWGSELLYAAVDGDSRHIDLLWPLWNVLDLTPEGRGTSWYPSVHYD